MDRKPVKTNLSADLVLQTRSTDFDHDNNNLLSTKQSMQFSQHHWEALISGVV